MRRPATRFRAILCAAVMAVCLSEAAAAGEGLTLEVGDEITLKAEDLLLRQVAGIAL